jgi:hypothetical protein
MSHAFFRTFSPNDKTPMNNWTKTERKQESAQKEGQKKLSERLQGVYRQNGNYFL